jgi:acyl-CoA synthetase (AMP-forming)/AMP-acid ligase II
MKIEMEGYEMNGSFCDILDAALVQFADKPCLSFGERKLSYREVDEASARVANALREAGFGLGMKAAVYALNSDQAFIATLGIVRAGGIWLPVNPRNSEADNTAILSSLGCDALFYQHCFSVAASSVRESCPEMIACVEFEPDPLRDVSQLALWSAAASTIAPQLPLTGKDLLSIPTTGGTTGQPKGVMLSHRNFCAIDFASRTSYLQPRAVMLCAAPMTHAAGRLAMTSLSSGAYLVVLDKVDPQLILRTIQDHGVTDLFLPPTAIYSLLDQKNLKDFDLSTLRSLSYGSAPMSIARLREALQKLGPVMRGGYGQTECPSFISALLQEDHFVDGRIAPDSRLRSAGRATCISELAILDESGHSLPAGERGEIAVKGGNVCEGYYEKPQETEGIRYDGWHLTGDIGYLDDDGFLFIVDRKKDMIISGGFNVYSAEVEQALMSLPGVREASVFGVPSEKWGEEVKALILPAPGSDLDAKELISACKLLLGSVKAPKSIDFVASFPMTANGKVDKKSLRSCYWSEQAYQI